VLMEITLEDVVSFLEDSVDTNNLLMPIRNSLAADFPDAVAQDPPSARRISQPLTSPAFADGSSHEPIFSVSPSSPSRAFQHHVVMPSVIGLPIATAASLSDSACSTNHRKIAPKKDARSHVCMWPDCGKGFSSRWSLERHLRNHGSAASGEEQQPDSFVERRLRERLRGVHQSLEKTKEKLQSHIRQQEQAELDLQEARQQCEAAQADIDEVVKCNKQLAQHMCDARSGIRHSSSKWRKENLQLHGGHRAPTRCREWEPSTSASVLYSQHPLNTVTPSDGIDVVRSAGHLMGEMGARIGNSERLGSGTDR